MNIEIPASVEQQAITNAAAAGFADVGQYVVSLIVTDSLDMTEAGIPEEALSDPYYEELVIAGLTGLNSGTPTPLTKYDFDEIRNAIIQRHLKK